MSTWFLDLNPSFSFLQDLTMETELEAVNGRKVRAIEVFAHALRFFREHALKVRPESSAQRVNSLSVISYVLPYRRSGRDPRFCFRR